GGRARAAGEHPPQLASVPRHALRARPLARQRPGRPASGGTPGTQQHLPWNAQPLRDQTGAALRAARKLFRATEQLMLSGTSTTSCGIGPAPVRAWLVLCALAILQFFIAVDVTAVNIALPSVGPDPRVRGHSLPW